MHIRKYLSIFLIGFVFVIAGCSGSSNSGVNKDPIEDIDGDGIADIVDPDIDGDGIPNKDDPDIDGDGEPNGVDPDADGDGTADAEDDTPGGFE